MQWAEKGGSVVIVTGDKDMLQLVTDRIVIVDTMKDKRYDIAAVQGRFGVAPDQVAHILALAGDATDNVPGVPGIGPKNAERLIQEFGTVDNLLAQIEKVKNARAKASLRAYADQARMCLELVRIRTDADVAIAPEELVRREQDPAALLPIFRDLEFSSILQELRLAEGDDRPWRAVTDTASLQDCREQLRTAAFLALEPVYGKVDPRGGVIVGMALAMRPGGVWYLPLPQQESAEWSTIGELLAREDLPKGGHDVKRLLAALPRHGLTLRGQTFDTMIAAYLANPGRKGFDLKELSLTYLNRSLPEAGRNEEGACRRAEAVRELAGILQEELEKDGLWELFETVEMRLVDVLARMERRGVLVDMAILKSMSRELQELIDLSAEKIYRLAGERFNINSPKQLQTILFDKLKMPRGRKIKEGYSTDGEVLAQLAATYELPAEILHYRGLVKLKGTYVDALPSLIHPETGRIHTSYNQTATATGRLSSSNPNLQNIPVRTLEGKRIRQAFVAPPGWGILTADYSQIELRILAHLAGDEILIDAFRRGEDIHVRTASTLFGTFPEMVNEAMRRQAKVINFGVIYGMSAFGLAKELGVPQKLAQTYIDGYFQKHTGIKRFIDETLDRARRLGYVQTLLNRRRYLPEIRSENATARA
ncbi:MAG: DNA polymerase I, partial [Syntrophales bacterium]|nr:DNA polymerase I [Syntrophales bacterium]